MCENKTDQRVAPLDNVGTGTGTQTCTVALHMLEKACRAIASDQIPWWLNRTQGCDLHIGLMGSQSRSRVYAPAVTALVGSRDIARLAQRKKAKVVARRGLDQGGLCSAAGALHALAQHLLLRHGATRKDNRDAHSGDEGLEWLALSEY